MSRKTLAENDKSDFIERFIEVCGTDQPAEIARLLDISYQAARNYLSGRLPDSNVLVSISQQTPFSIHWLLTGQGQKFVEIEQTDDAEIFTDEMRAFVRRECRLAVNEILSDQTGVNLPRIVVLPSEEIKEEKISEEKESLSSPR